MDRTDRARAGHETSDVSVRGIVWFGVGLAVTAVLIQVAMWGLFRVLQRRERRVDVPVSAMVAASLRRTPPEPRLEPNPLELRRRMRAQEDAVLTTYGWVDRNTGVVRIPIGRAMEILAGRGLPTTKAVTPGPGPGRGTRDAGQPKAPTP